MLFEGYQVLKREGEGRGPQGELTTFVRPRPIGVGPYAPTVQDLILTIYSALSACSQCCTIVADNQLVPTWGNNTQLGMWHGAWRLRMLAVVCGPV